MMVLVVSCPLKRMLLNNYASNTIAAAKTNQTIIAQPAGNHLSNRQDCFIALNKIFSVNQELPGHRTLPSPLYLPAINKQPGADIHYLLSDLDYNQFNLTSNQYATLPLFLKHMRLLI